MPFQHPQQRSNTDPGFIAEAVTPHDSTNFTNGVCRGIYVGGTGDVAVVFQDGTAVTFESVPVGVILPVCAIRVNDTNTDATALVAIF